MQCHAYRLGTLFSVKFWHVLLFKVMCIFKVCKIFPLEKMGDAVVNFFRFPVYLVLVFNNLPGSDLGKDNNATILLLKSVTLG